MSLFGKKKKDEGEDFILDFSNSQPVADENSEEGVDGLSVTLWDDRKPHRPSHAMTVDEILGNFQQPDPEESEHSDVDEKTDVALAEAAKVEDESSSVSEDEASVAPEGEASFVIPVAPPAALEIEIEAPAEQTAAERADALINRLKKENSIPLKEETASASEEPPKKSEPILAEEVVEAPTVLPTEAPDTDKPEESLPTETTEEKPKLQVTEEPEKTFEAEHEKMAEAPSEAVPQKKDFKLSPTAQALYDRMMAERAKMQSAASHTTPAEEKPELPADKTPEASETPADIVSEVIPEIETAPETPSSIDVVSVTEEPARGKPENDESISDSLFDSINESMKSNPLSRIMERSTESMLSKCKTYIAPASDVKRTPGSIDDIIKAAEKRARERLSNLYDTQNGIPVAPLSATHEFSPFIQTTATDDEGKSISIPVKIQDETSDGAIISSTNGDMSDFQCSFADNSNTVDTDATRIIDISSHSVPPKADPVSTVIDLTSNEGTPHTTDPVKSEVWQELLKPLTEKTEEIVIPVEPLKFGVTEESELPEAEVGETPEEVPELEDYNSIEDAEGVRTDLASQQVSVMARLIPTVCITAIISVVDIFLKETLLAASPTALVLLNLILFGVALAINFRTLKGISSLLGGIPDIDSPTALATLCTFLYTVVSCVFGKLAEVPFLAPAATLILCFNLWGKLSIIKRIRRGFEVIANNDEKKALTFVEDKMAASVMASGGVIGDALICQGKKTTNIKDYLKNAFSEDLYEKKVAPLMLFTVIVGAVAALFAFFMNDGVIPAVAAFTAVTCAGCPIAAIFCCNLPLSLLSKKLAGYGAMLAGHPAAEAIANANAVAFDAADLFPKGTIKLYNMQVIESGAVDKYIASASAILTAAGSPLAPIFEEILETNNEEIPVADSIKYETNMGVSGWIEDSHILVGNRTLMEAHNIKAPNLELDKKILRQGYFPLYLACDQQLCALFVVGYEADEEITYELRNLCNTGVTMLINSNDPNLSEEMLCDYFGLYPDLVKVMSTTAVSAYKTAGAYTESVSAPASYGENISGLLAIVTSSIRMKSILTTMLIIQLLLFVLGIALTGYYIFTAGIMSLPLLGVLGFQLAGALITSLVAHLRQP